MSPLPSIEELYRRYEEAVKRNSREYTEEYIRECMPRWLRHIAKGIESHVDEMNESSDGELHAPFHFTFFDPAISNEKQADAVIEELKKERYDAYSRHDCIIVRASLKRRRDDDDEDESF